MLKDLNEYQKDVVLHTHGALIVAAGAGSGKTKTLISKLDYLINEVGIAPKKIWSFSFTNAAVIEVSERLEKKLGKEVAGSVRVSTLHSTSNKIRKQALLSLDPYYRSPKIMKYSGPVLNHLFAILNKGNYKSGDAKGILSFIEKLKLDLVTPENYKKFYPYDEEPTNRASEEQTIHDIYTAYQKYLKRTNQMDYGDMLVGCYNVLIDPRYSDFLLRLQKNCEYILVDECQDINTVSHRIVELMMGYHKNITLLGDLRQAIFSFQGSVPELVKDFAEKHKAKIADLPINYRSTKTIVNNANKLISYQSGLLGKPSITPNEIGANITYNTSHNESEEAAWICDKINDLVSEGHEYRDITLLYRVHSQAMDTVSELYMHDIPHVQLVKTNFYLRKEMKDVIAYLKIACDYPEVSFKTIQTIIHKPTRYISRTTVTAIKDHMDREGCSAMEALDHSHEMNIDSRQMRNVDNLHSQLKQLYFFHSDSSTGEVIDYIFDKIGYRNFAEDDKDGDSQSDTGMNLDAVRRQISMHESVEDFLEHVEREISESTKPVDPNANQVTLQSTHSSKGLEFKIVILMGFCHRLYPFHLAVREGNEDEERRIVYVAITRPVKKLYISLINGHYGRYKVEPSPYIYDMDFIYDGNNNLDEKIDDLSCL